MRSRDSRRSSFAIDINVGDLMVAHSERPAAEGVEHFAERPGRTFRNPALPQYAIDQNRPAHVAMAVLADDPHTRPAFTGRVEDDGTSLIQLADQPRHVAAGRTESLQVVIQMRQIDQRQIGPILLDDRGSAASDPVGAREPGVRSPKRVERESGPARAQGARTGHEARR